MRELKFRAWDPREDKIFDVKSICENGALEGNLNDLEENQGSWIPCCRMTLMQYTGLKDKNGKEIYEGDIVKFLVGENLTDVFIGDIYWFENEAEFDIRHPEGYHGHYSFKRDFIEVFKIEVIGNIYENPELMEK